MFACAHVDAWAPKNMLKGSTVWSKFDLCCCHAPKYHSLDLKTCFLDLDNCIGEIINHVCSCFV